MPEVNQPSPPSFSASTSPTLQQLVDYAAERFTDPDILKRLEAMSANAQARGITVADVAKTFSGIADVSAEAAAKVIGAFTGIVLKVLELAGPSFNEIAKAGIDVMLGGGEKMGGQSVGDDAGQRLIDRLMPQSGAQLEPDIKPATHFVGTLLRMEIENLMFGAALESVSESLHFIGGIEAFADIDDVIAKVMGGGRVARRVLAPFVDTSIVTPARWHTNKQYRPELLSASAAIEAFRRGALSQADLTEELARQGWSDARIQIFIDNAAPLLSAGAAIEAFQRGRYTGQQLTDELTKQGWDAERINVLVDNARRRLSVDDLLFLYYRGAIDDATTQQMIAQLGYDSATAAALFTIATKKRTERYLLAQVDAAVDAYVNRQIDEPELTPIVRNNVPIQQEQVFIITTAKLLRGYRTKRLHADDVRSAVLDGILAPSDYRRALERDGWELQAIDVKELQLRIELDERRDLARARAEQAAERAAREQQAAIDKAARAAEIADRRARAEFPSLAEYRRAYVHGRIDRDLYVAALTREHIVQDLDVILLDADADRDAYLAELAARDVVVAKPQPTGLSIATLETAVLNDVLTLGEFDARLAQAGIPDVDRNLLVSLLQTKLDARDDARVKRAEAAARVAAGGVSLDAYERAVRLGVRTRQQYADYLAGIGTPDLARALILELLDAQLAQDAAARTTREQRDAPAAAKGISLAQRRRAVIAGVRTIDTYEDALRAAGWPVDDQLLELDLLRAELAAAAEARARRDALGKETPARTLTLGQLEKAFTLGLIDGAEFTTALRALAYSDADIALIVGINATAIEDVRAAQLQREQIRADLAQKQIALADLERLVRRGVQTLGEYGAALTERGYREDAIALMVQLLSEEIGIDLDGLRKRIGDTLAKTDGAPTIAEIEADFAAGAVDSVDVLEFLLSVGVPHDAALVYSRLLGTFVQEG
jgi:hypothetical protein